MQGNKNILNELGAISPAVAGIGSEMPYGVPDGYFEGLAGSVMARIKALRALTAYEAPAGYFDSFAEKLMLRIQAEKAGSAQEELAILSPLLSGLAKKTPFSEPAGYFSQLSGNLSAGIHAVEFVNHELENLSPLMDGLKNKQVYTTPEGYFNNLAEHVLAGIKAASPSQTVAQPAKLISIDSRSGSGTTQRSWVGRWGKYAVAAVLAGVLVVTGLRVFHINKPAGGSSTEEVGTNLTKLSDQEIVTFLETQNEPLAEAVSNSTATLDMNDNDVKDILGDVPDAELNQYVDEHGSSKDPITN